MSIANRDLIAKLYESREFKAYKACLTGKEQRRVAAAVQVAEDLAILSTRAGSETVPEIIKKFEAIKRKVPRTKLSRGDVEAAMAACPEQMAAYVAASHNAIAANVGALLDAFKKLRSMQEREAGRSKK
jgi:hypothetical protein